MRAAVIALASLASVAPILAPGAAQAQFGARARVTPPIAAGSDVDPTASATTVELDDRPRALETTDEVLLEVPGARRRRVGGYGAFTSLSLRGAEAEHTQVLIGDVPLAGADGSAFDLSTIPPWLFDRVEVFRGGAPVWLGAGAIGGVLRLVPRSARGTRAEAVAGAGSWDLAQGRASATVDGRDASVTAIAGLTSSSGAYELALDRRGLTPGEDRVAHQSNAQLLEASGLLHARLRSAAGTFSIVALGLERTGGVPPPMLRWSEQLDSRRTQARGLFAVSGEWLEGGRPPEQADLAAWRAQIVASVGLERRRFSDRYGLVGQIPRDGDDRLARYTLRAATTFRIAEWLSASVVGVGSHEHFDPSDLLADHELAPSYRQGGTLAGELRAHGREGDLRWEIRGSGRIELLDVHTRDVRPDRADERNDALYAMPTARLAGVVEIVPGIAIQASAATATRAPGAIEIFGDGGLLLGNARLLPEQSRTIDGGVVLRGSAGPIAGSAEVRGFGLWMTDLIRPQLNTQHQITFANVGSAWTAGIEGSARVRFEDWVSLTGAITWLETRDETRGRELPFRPRLTAYARPAVHVPGIGPLDRASAYADLDYVAGAFGDPDNSTSIPEQLYLGAGISLEAFGGIARLDVVVRNILDARLVDLTERPLPGRSFAIQLALRTE